MPNRLLIVALAITLLGLCSSAACAESKRPPGLPSSTGPVPRTNPLSFGTVDLHYDSRVLRVEAATTREQIQLGLAYRETLDPDSGMIFDLHVNEVPSFWMKGMRF